MNKKKSPRKSNHFFLFYHRNRMEAESFTKAQDEGKQTRGDNPLPLGRFGASLEQLEEEKLLRFEKIDLLTSVLDEEFSDA